MKCNNGLNKSCVCVREREEGGKGEGEGEGDRYLSSPLKTCRKLKKIVRLLEATSLC